MQRKKQLFFVVTKFKIREIATFQARFNWLSKMEYLDLKYILCYNSVFPRFVLIQIFFISDAFIKLNR